MQRNALARQASLIGVTALLVMVAAVVFQISTSPTTERVPAATQAGEAGPDGGQGYPGPLTPPPPPSPAPTSQAAPGDGQGYPGPATPSSTAIIAPAISLETLIAQMTAEIPSPEPSPTPSIMVGAATVQERGGNFRVQLREGWWAAAKGTTVLTNYDPQSSSNEFESGELKIQIGVVRLDPGQTFSEWLSALIVGQTTPVVGW